MSTAPLSIAALMADGAHFGYSRSRRHPSTLPYLYGTKLSQDIINLEKTLTQATDAREFLQSVRNAGRTIVLVGTKPELRDVTRMVADRNNMPYVDIRWIGGTLTNWKEIKRRIDRMAQLDEEVRTDTLVYRTKKERLMLERELGKLTVSFGGLKSLAGTPGALICLDSRHEAIALQEATKLGVPVVSVSNTDCDLKTVSYPIMLNDSSRKAVSQVLDFITAFDSPEVAPEAAEAKEATAAPVEA